MDQAAAATTGNPFLEPLERNPRSVADLHESVGSVFGLSTVETQIQDWVRVVSGTEVLFQKVYELLLSRLDVPEQVVEQA